MKIVSSKFLEFAVDILREDEKIYEYGYVKKVPKQKLPQVDLEVKIIYF